MGLAPASFVCRQDKSSADCRHMPARCLISKTFCWGGYASVPTHRLRFSKYRICFNQSRSVQIIIHAPPWRDVLSTRTMLSKDILAASCRRSVSLWSGFVTNPTGLIVCTFIIFIWNIHSTSRLHNSLCSLASPAYSVASFIDGTSFNFNSCINFSSSADNALTFWLIFFQNFDQPEYHFCDIWIETTILFAQLRNQVELCNVVRGIEPISASLVGVAIFMRQDWITCSR